MVAMSEAWISLWTGADIRTRFPYSSVPPFAAGLLWWQWISWASMIEPVTAHFPCCAAYREIRLSAYSIDLPCTGFRISQSIVLVSIQKFVSISIHTNHGRLTPGISDAPSTSGQLSALTLRPELRHLSADFTELLTIGGCAPMPVGVSVRTLRGVTPSFHPSKYQFSKILDFFSPSTCA